MTPYYTIGVDRAAHAAAGVLLPSTLKSGFRKLSADHRTLDVRPHKLSSFADEWLSFDIELDGWLRDALEITDSKKGALDGIPGISHRLGSQKRQLVRRRRTASEDWVT